MATEDLTPISTAPVGIPKLTLGWQILEWADRYLLQPDGDHAGDPWHFTPEQAHFILHWYALKPSGKFRYRRGVLRRMKGWGKDPVGAAICMIELCGPCKFSHFDSNGQPVGKPQPASWVQTAAVSFEQTENTTSLFSGLISDKMRKKYKLEIGKTMVYSRSTKALRSLKAVTSSVSTREGPRTTFFLKNETHLWVQNNGGLAMSGVINRNAAKVDTRTLSITNAHSLSATSVGLRDYEARDQKDVLYDSLEAAEGVTLDSDDKTLRKALPVGDSKWINRNRIVREIRDSTTDPADSERFYLNRISEESDRAFDFAKWQEGNIVGYSTPAKCKIALGFDGSTTNDWTALIGTELESGYQWAVGIWKPQYHESEGEWRIDQADVNEKVTEAFDFYDVAVLVADPYWWKEWISRWAGLFNRPGKERVISWNTTNYKRTAFAVLNYKKAIAEGDITHSKDADFAQGIRNAQKHMHTFLDDNKVPMFTIEKQRPGSALKIDPAMAGALSWEGRSIAIAKGALKPKTGVSFYSADEDREEARAVGV